MKEIKNVENVEVVDVMDETEKTGFLKKMGDGIKKINFKKVAVVTGVGVVGLTIGYIVGQKTAGEFVEWINDSADVVDAVQNTLDEVKNLETVEF